jgi:hypothetical protein
VDIASPYEAMSALSVRDETDARSIQGLPKERSHAPSIISTANKTQSSFTAPYGSRTEMSYAPHMLGTQQGLQDAQKPGNDGWSIVGGKKPIPGIAFNAWDNTGQKHSQMRLPSTATGSTAPRTMENLLPTNNTPGRSNWAKVVSTSKVVAEYLLMIARSPDVNIPSRTIPCLEWLREPLNHHGRTMLRRMTSRMRFDRSRYASRKTSVWLVHDSRETNAIGRQYLSTFTLL